MKLCIDGQFDPFDALDHAPSIDSFARTKNKDSDQVILMGTAERGCSDVDCRFTRVCCVLDF
ncbi:hypothetical protein FHS27_002579 [Rhodopirellula rubra]|uniref:Uncharacterized protein n=1 Tax=Aporhodopirellula rubra TaxID=980271 RepID=A0A7W5H4U2_9BACT|nr:hypothetical protein [Aporhodopirellula rubra]